MAIFKLTILTQLLEWLFRKLWIIFIEGYELYAFEELHWANCMDHNRPYHIFDPILTGRQSGQK